jgi:acyl carrier protein
VITQEMILEKVLACLHDMLSKGQAVGITSDSDLIDDLGLESIKMMDLLMTLEDEYDLSIPINILMDVRTPGQLAASLVAYMENGHGSV